MDFYCLLGYNIVYYINDWWGYMELDITKFSDEIKNQSIGKLSPDIVNFILSKKPDFKGRISSNKDILFWAARVKHIEKHRRDFNATNSFDDCCKKIPSIIENPDYISIHPKDESVSFIKKFDQNVSVAIKISTEGDMVFRTMYPLRDSQLNNYIANGRCWKIES